MSNPADKPTREARLAAKLRENLRRRKAQARERPRDGEREDGAADEPLSKGQEDS